MKRIIALVAVFLFLFSIVPVARAAQYTSLYATQPVNIRYGPSTKNAIIGELKTGQEVYYLGQSGNWYLVNSNGLTGYVYSKYLTTAQLTGSGWYTAPGVGSSYVIAKANVNVRLGPSTKYGKLGAIGIGQSAVLLGSSGNWLKIQWGSQTGYVYKKYFTISSTPTYPTYPTTPSYPSVPGYYDDGRNSEFFAKLDRSGYFISNAGIYVGRFTDSQGIPNIRITNGTNLNIVAADLKALLKNFGMFRLVNSSLPAGANAAYLSYNIVQMNATYQSLSPAQKAQLQVIGMAYDPARDAVIVRINNLSADKVQLFKTWVSAWPYLQFESPSYYYIP
jgi:uncharacterized protein YraI